MIKKLLRFIKTPWKRLFKPFASMMQLSFSEGVVAGLRFFTILAIRAHINIESTGIYIFGITLGYILGMISDFGQSQYMIRHLSIDRTSYSVKYGSALWFRLIASSFFL